MKKTRKPWSLRKKIVLSFVLVLVLLLASIGVQVAINIGIQPVASSPSESYDYGGAERLLYYYDLAYHGDGLPEGIELTETFVNSELAGVYRYVNGRYDCSDFRVNTLVRLYYGYGENLPESTKGDLKTVLTGFKYWMDQGGSDSMCYWSENHQILFAVSEYLVGQLFPDEVFSVDGKTGEEHMAMAASRIDSWMELRYLYGFTEWYSNNYYPEDIAPMANFIQFADDASRVTRMKMIMDVIWYDLASQCFPYEGTDAASGDPRTYYIFQSSSGRMYSDNRASDDTGNRLRNYTDFVLQPDETESFAGSWKTSSNGFFNCFRQMLEATDGEGNPYYEVPEVLKAIFNDSSASKIVKSSQSLDVEELEGEGLLGQDDKSIMMQFDMEAFTNPEVIDNAIQYIARTGMFTNEFTNDFKLVNIWLLRGLHALGAVSTLLHPSLDGISIQRANVYTYRNGSYSLSTAQAYQTGDYGDQQAVSQAVLSNYLSVFTTQPAKIARRTGTPTYWVGNGRNPYSVQEKNVNLSIYIPPTKVGFMEPMIIEKTTHAFFPVQLFDEVDESHLDDGIIFGEANGTYIALIARYALSFLSFEESTDEGNFDNMLARGSVGNVITEEYDLVQVGEGAHYWVTELSDSSVETFQEFVARVLANPVEFDETTNTLSYSTVLDGDSSSTLLEAVYGTSFSVNGTVQDLQYDRYESAWVENGTLARKAGEIVYSYGGHSLRLDYEAGIREEN